MKVSNQTDLSHVASLPAEGIIEAAAIIKVTAIEGMTIGLHTTPRGATPILDANKVILNEDPIPGVLPTLVHQRDVLTGLDLCPDPVGGADPIFTPEPDPDQDLMEGRAVILGVATVQDPQTASTPSKILSHPGRTDDLTLKLLNVRPIFKAR